MTKTRAFSSSCLGSEYLCKKGPEGGEGRGGTRQRRQARTSRHKRRAKAVKTRTKKTGVVQGNVTNRSGSSRGFEDEAGEMTKGEVRGQGGEGRRMEGKHNWSGDESVGRGS